MTVKSEQTAKSAALHENLVYIFAQANQRVHKNLEHRLKSEGMQVNHWRILETLSNQRGHSMGDLANIVLINHPTLTKMLDRMVSQGLVHRALDARDNRRVLVMITDRGLELYERLHVHAAECHTEFEQYLGTQRWSALKEILYQVIDQQ